MKTYRFPEGFVWGAATSAYQVEGSPLADGAKPSILHRYAHTFGNTHEGATGDVAADHYRRWRDDVALMRELGLPHYEFSIPWARVIPDGTGTVNQRALDFYDGLIDALLEAGIAPAPILYVWDLPGALQDRGGWANRDSAEWFGEYAAVVFDRFGDRASHWFTICEPYVVAHVGHVEGTMAPATRDVFAGMRATHHLALAHGRAVQAFRASGAAGEIGTSTMMLDVQPASEDEADVAAARRVGEYMNAMYLDPIMLGSYPVEITERLRDFWPPIEPDDLEIASSPVDFLGFTYYLGAWAAEAAGDPGGTAVESMLDVRLSWGDGPKTGCGWSIHPQGLLNVLRWLHDRYDGPPLLMTESGGAFPDTVTDDGHVHDLDRIDFIRDHLIVAHQAIAEGIDLRGWFVWSFLDTWEFSRGYQDRFGLVHVDYWTLRRTIKDSGYWFRDVVAANGVVDEPARSR